MVLRISFICGLLLGFLYQNLVESRDIEDSLTPKKEEDVIALWMPHVNTTGEDEYHCMGVDVAWDRRYITKYVPHASQKSVHHILIYGCASKLNIPSSNGAWKCLNDHPIQQACQGGQKFLYAWAKDAPALDLPGDVGFEIGLSTSVRGIFMQVHYSTVVQDDNSGISIILSEEPRKYAAGIFLLAGGGQFIPPHEPVVNVNVMCRYTDDIVLHPFAYRTHAHELGVVISGWYMKPEDQKERKWTLMGKQSPQNPQAFYNMAEAHNITKGTILGARCVYNSMARTGPTFMGATHKDEMCNFYMMYYSTRSTVREGCGDVSQDLQDFQLPASASEPLPADQMTGHHHHAMPDSTTAAPVIPDMVVPEDTVSSAAPRRRPSLEQPDQDTSNGHGRDGEAEENSLPIDKKADGNPVLKPVSSGDHEMDHGMYGGHEGHDGPIVGVPNKSGYEEIEHWGESLKALKLGQISGIALNHADTKVYIFHRRDHTWDGSSFGFDNVYAKIEQGPIVDSTILVVDRVSGKIESKIGENMFYMPHGITVGRDGDVWVTDVALHQVIRLKEGKPTMILGAKFAPGHDGEHFCKPTMVAIHSNGEFYVADGYCNSRVIKFTPDGRYISHFGRAQTNFGLNFGSITPDPMDFNVPHDVKLSDDESVVFVADRENGRVQAFRSDTMKFLHLYQVPEFGFRVYAIDVAGDVLVAVNGPSGLPAERVDVHAILVNISTGLTTGLVNSLATPMVSPHAVAMSRDRSCIFVVELNGNILQFHRIGSPSTALPAANRDTGLLHELSRGPASSKQNSTRLVDHLTSNPFTPVDGGYSYLLMTIFIAPLLLLCCGAGFCCFRKTRRTSTAKWRDVLYTYKTAAKDLKTPRDFKHSKEGFRPLKQDDTYDDDSDSEEEVFSAQKSQKRTNMA